MLSSLAREGRPRPGPHAALRALALLLRLLLLVLVDRRTALEDGDDVVRRHDPLNAHRGILGRRGRIADPAHRGDREQHDGGQCTDEGDAKRARAEATPVISDACFEAMDELRCRLGAAGPQLGFEVETFVPFPPVTHFGEPPGIVSVACTPYYRDASRFLTGSVSSTPRIPRRRPSARCRATSMAFVRAPSSSAI